MRLEPGVEGSATLMVTDEDTAAALGSGDVVVLGTPRVVALCEAATVTAIAGGLREEQTAVGTRVEIDHLLPATVGAVVTARARLVEVDGRRLVFDVEAREGDRIVARGRVTRTVVDRARFAAATDGSPSDADV